ncbi:MULTISPECIES: TonB-dependent siderophore receptor [unclassified Pseudomonas]|uniref:TonB-dependent siderophore receptor n=1 Tax=unclassified Pseudomonas TaxID=196821 RepID=UPI00244769E3|nr:MULTISPECIES: TonB-dependent siderophore receptor [unclassified Pseudomonas]MDH0893598.1 TonB-dependent siderophore receptor [Pseudomonas sp. GD03875]MDH1065751.1 TonB-dependent siderophore receptor [Pseudomonas sp. GD03985]
MVFRLPRQPARTAALAPSTVVRGEASPTCRPHLLAFAIGCALTGLAGAATLAPGHALAADPTSAASREYTIPAGSLSDALAQFAAASGVQLVFDPRMLDGLSSNGLQGSYSVHEGFERLLAGSGYQLVSTGNGGYSLHQATSGDGATTLAPTSVTGVALVTGTTEGSGSYTTGSMNTATKLPLSIRETPQSVTVITRQRMDDQAMAKVSDALVNTPGIVAHSNSGPGREIYFSRGFQVENYTFDGLPTSVFYGQLLLNDLAMYDRVEVVRGSAGLTQGTGTPSAAINFVRKRPTRDFQASLQGQVGSWDHYGLQTDVSGPVNEAGTLRGRMVVSGRDSDSFQDVAEEKRQLYYFVGEADLSEDTLLTLGLSHQKNNDIMTWSGLPSDPYGRDMKLSRSTFLGNKGDFWDILNTNVFASLEHRFANDWKVNLSANWIWAETDARASSAGYDATLQPRLVGWSSKSDNDRVSYDLSAQGPFELLGRKHELVLGASYRTVDNEGRTGGYWALAPTLATGIDFDNWSHDAVWPGGFDDHHDHDFDNDERQHGYYVTTRLNLADPLKLILGARLDWFEQESTGRYIVPTTGDWLPTASGYSYDRHLTKYAGLVYDLDAQHSVYVSYTDIFKPQNLRDASDKFIEPVVGKNYEIGIKGEYFDGALNANASVFRIDQENLGMALDDQPTSCPFYPTRTCHEAAGLVRSEGYELEAQGAVTSNWQLGGGYTYASSEIRKDANPSRIGTKRNTNMPTQQLKLFTSYRLPGDQWRIGGNLRWQNGVYDEGTLRGQAYRFNQGGYAIADAMVGYQHDEHLDVQLNVTNLFDKTYYRIIPTSGGNALYGEPRKFMLTAKYSF